MRGWMPLLLRRCVCHPLKHSISPSNVWFESPMLRGTCYNPFLHLLLIRPDCLVLVKSSWYAYVARCWKHKEEQSLKTMWRVQTTSASISKTNQMPSYLPDALSASGKDSFTKPNPSSYLFIQMQSLVHNEVPVPNLLQWSYHFSRMYPVSRP